MTELQEIFSGPKQGMGMPYMEIGEGDENSIKFTLQQGPIKDNGVNGCQIDKMIYATAEILRFFNKRFSCRENSCAITHLDEALMWLEKRKKDRETRNVEGLDKE